MAHSTMSNYVALLRGINVSGQKIIKMEDLKKIFESLKFENVKTYIQSGNVIFESKESNLEILTIKIEKFLKAKLGYEVTVIIRTMEKMKEIVACNPFKKNKDKDAKPYVTFLSKKPEYIKIPLVSNDKSVEVFSIIDYDAFSLSRKVKGKSGFPNSFLESKLKIHATTRNWNTVSKIASF